MRWWFRVLLLCCCLVVVFVVPGMAASVDVVDGAGADDVLAGYSVEAPLPVEIVPADDSFPDVSVPGDFSVDTISDFDTEFPGSPLFTGCWWVSGSDVRLGQITVYLPVDTDRSQFGLDASGRLVYVGSGSVSGYLAGVRNNRVTFSSFSGGSYSEADGPSWDTYDLQLSPTATNLDIATTLLSPFDVWAYVPYLIVLFGGVVVLCCMRR